MFCLWSVLRLPGLSGGCAQRPCPAPSNSKCLSPRGVTQLCKQPAGGVPRSPLAAVTRVAGVHCSFPMGSLVFCPTAGAAVGVAKEIAPLPWFPEAHRRSPRSPSGSLPWVTYTGDIRVNSQLSDTHAEGPPSADCSRAAWAMGSGKGQRGKNRSCRSLGPDGLNPVAKTTWTAVNGSGKSDLGGGRPRASPILHSSVGQESGSPLRQPWCVFSWK